MVKFICDGCGKEAEASFARLGEPVKPHGWYVRGDDDGVQHACSRPCIGKIAASTGKTSVVLPV